MKKKHNYHKITKEEYDEQLISCDFCSVIKKYKILVSGPYDNLICQKCSDIFVEENNYLIRKNPQLIVEKGKGDCFRACLTSLLCLPNNDTFPNIDDKDWFLKFNKLLEEFGMIIIYDFKAFRRLGYWIACVKSKNYDKTDHAIIMNGQEVYFDPSTKIRYNIGENMLGKGTIKGGWYLEVINSSKLYKLIELQKA